MVVVFHKMINYANVNEREEEDKNRQHEESQTSVLWPFCHTSIISAGSVN
jgi:hypothetical protein